MDILKYSDILVVGPHSLKYTHFFFLKSVVDSESLIASLLSSLTPLSCLHIKEL